MKTLKNISAVALFFASTVAFANTSAVDNPSLWLSKKNPSEVKEEPFFRKSGDKLFLNFFNREMGDIQIRVVDSENRVLYSETLKATLVVEKAFNFEKAEKDSYKVILKEGNETYAEYYLVK